MTQNEYFNMILTQLKEQAAAIKSLAHTVENLQRYHLKKNHYKVIYHGNLFPVNMEDSERNPYDFYSDKDILPGDFIRVHDDFYNMGTAKVARREYNATEDVIFLFCESSSIFDDYIYSNSYELDIKIWISKYPDKFKVGVEPEGKDIAEMINALTKHKTTINHYKVRDFTNKLLGELLNYKPTPIEILSY